MTLMWVANVLRCGESSLFAAQAAILINIGAMGRFCFYG